MSMVTKIHDKFRIHASPWLQPVLDKLLERPLALKRFRAKEVLIRDELQQRGGDAMMFAARKALLQAIAELPPVPVAPRSCCSFASHGKLGGAWWKMVAGARFMPNLTLRKSAFRSFPSAGNEFPTPWC